jgi:hypothetical protein
VPHRAVRRRVADADFPVRDTNADTGALCAAALPIGVPVARLSTAAWIYDTPALCEIGTASFYMQEPLNLLLAAVLA